MANDKFLTKALFPKFKSAMPEISGIISHRSNFLNQIVVTVCFDAFGRNGYHTVNFDDLNENDISEAISKLSRHKKRLYNFSKNMPSSSTYQLQDKWTYEHPDSDNYPSSRLVDIYNEVISSLDTREEILDVLDIIDLDRAVYEIDYVSDFIMKFSNNTSVISEYYE